MESNTAAQFLASFPRQQLNGHLQVTVALHTSFLVPHLSFCAIGNDLQQPQLLAACVCMSSFGQCLHTIIKKSPKTRFKSMCSWLFLSRIQKKWAHAKQLLLEAWIWNLHSSWSAEPCFLFRQTWVFSSCKLANLPKSPLNLGSRVSERTSLICLIKVLTMMDALAKCSVLLHRSICCVVCLD